MRAPLFLISLALSSAACSQPGQYADDVGVNRTETTTVTAKGDGDAKASSVSNSNGAVNFEDNATHNGANREFSYSWPAEVGAQPQLVAQLVAERDKALAEQKKNWREAQAEFVDQDCTACRSLTYQVEWKTVADLPQWLSLTEDVYEFTGGAHGMSGRHSLVWDKVKQVGMKPVDMFTSAVALENALGQSLCTALDKERASRGVAPVSEDDDIFQKCPGLDVATVILGSSNGKTFDRIGVYYGPYVAGPYSDGDYELSFPVTASVIDAVKPEYASVFSVKR